MEIFLQSIKKVRTNIGSDFNFLRFYKSQSFFTTLAPEVSTINSGSPR
jgi:hypothetical protein